MRHVIANQFRVFDRDAWAPAPWPWLYGDAVALPPAETPRQNMIDLLLNTAPMTDDELAKEVHELKRRNETPMPLIEMFDATLGFCNLTAYITFFVLRDAEWPSPMSGSEIPEMGDG